MNSKKNKIIRYIIVIFLISITFLHISCSCQKEYQLEDWQAVEFILKEDDPHYTGMNHQLFSLEHPACFHLIPITGPQYLGYTRLIFTKEGVGEQSSNILERLSIKVFPRGTSGYVSANSSFSKAINEGTTSTYIENYSVLDDSQVFIDGIYGKYLYIYYERPPVEPSQPLKIYEKTVWFDFQECVWEICLVFGPEFDLKSTEEVGQVFDEIVESFKFLD